MNVQAGERLRLSLEFDRSGSGDTALVIQRGQYLISDSTKWATLVDDPRRPLSFRGRLRFDRAAGPDGAGESTQTTVIIIEESYEEAVAKARSMDERQLGGLLRSTLPER